MKLFSSLNFINILLLLFFAITLNAKSASECSFYASLDKKTTADKSAGVSVPLKDCSQISPQSLGAGRIIGVPAGSQKKFYIKYNSINNISSKQGCASIWLKPLDWDGKNKNFQVLFSASGTDAILQLYKYQDVGSASGSSNRLLLLYGQSKKKNGKYNWTMLRAPKTFEFKKGELYNLVFFWGKKMSIYVNGKLLTSTANKHIPLSEFSNFTLGVENEWKPAGGTTLVNDVKIYKTLLDDNAIYSNYHKKQAETAGDSFAIALGQANKKTNIDGIISTGEYSFSATGFMDISGMNKYAEIQSRYYLNYDDKNLYVAVKTPFSGKLNALKRSRDDVTVCKDDCVEVYLTSNNKNDVHFIINAENAVYDENNTEGKSFNLEGLEFKNRIKDKYWILEIAIPFSSLKSKSPVENSIYQINIARSFAESGTFTSIAPCFSSYKSATIPLRFVKSAPELSIVGNLEDELLNFDFSSSREAKENLDFCLKKDETSSSSEINKKFVLNGKKLNIKQKSGKSGSLKLSITSPEYGTVYKAFFKYSTKKENNYKYQYTYTVLEDGIAKIGLYQSVPLVNGQPLQGNIKFFDKDKNLVINKIFSGKANNYAVDVDIKKIPIGKYDVLITLNSSQGHEQWRYQYVYEKFPDTPYWLGNKIGISSKVPVPWTPVKVMDKTIEVFGRKYIFKDSIFPAQIIAANEELLAAPINFTEIRKSRKETFKLKTFKVAKTTPEACLISVGAESKDLKVNAQIRIEFDGFMWYDLTFTPSGKSSYITELYLLIPFTKESATLMNLADYRLRRTGAIPDNSVVTKDLLNETPIFWIGNDNAGLQFFAEKLQGFKIKNPEKILQISREKDKVYAKVNIFDSPLTLKDARKMSFGLQATPVKPPRKGWRDWRVMDNIIIHFNRITKQYNYAKMDQVNPVMRKKLEQYKQQGKKVLPYMAFQATAAYSPEYQYFGDNWRLYPAMWDRILPQRADFPMPDGLAHYLVCANSKAFRDYYVYTLEKLFSGLKLDGIYFDWANAMQCRNHLHGCGWKDDNGKVWKSFNILGLRKLAQRIYVMTRERNPDSVIMHHPGGLLAAPVISFADIIIDGENLSYQVGKNKSYHFLRLDQFRAAYTGTPWGMVELIIPQFIRAAQLYNPQSLAFYKSPASDKVKDHLSALLMVHDTKSYSIFGYDMKKIREIQKKFTWDDQVKFYPYWDKNNIFSLVSPDDANVVVSAYTRGEKIMLVPFNNTDKYTTVKLKITGTYQDALSGKKFKDENGILTIPLEARTFAALIGN